MKRIMPFVPSAASEIVSRGNCETVTSSCVWHSNIKIRVFALVFCNDETTLRNTAAEISGSFPSFVVYQIWPRMALIRVVFDAFLTSESVRREIDPRIVWISATMVRILPTPASAFLGFVSNSVFWYLTMHFFIVIHGVFDVAVQTKKDLRIISVLLFTCWVWVICTTVFCRRTETT